MSEIKKAPTELENLIKLGKNQGILEERQKAMELVLALREIREIRDVLFSECEECDQTADIAKEALKRYEASINTNS